MFGNSSDNAVQEKVYQDYSKDGAMVTSLGCLIAGIGVMVIFWAAIWSGLSPLAAALGTFTTLVPLTAIILLCLLLIRYWRLKLTFPRLGYSKFILKRALPRKWMPRYIVLLFVFDLLFMLATDYSLKIASGELPVAEDVSDIGRTAAIAAGTTLAVLGFHLGIEKVLTLALPMLALIVLVSFIGISYGWIFLAAGAILIWIGYQRLRDFLREFPIEVNTDVQ